MYFYNLYVTFTAPSAAVGGTFVSTYTTESNNTDNKIVKFEGNKETQQSRSFSSTMEQYANRFASRNGLSLEERTNNWVKKRNLERNLERSGEDMFLYRMRGLGANRDYDAEAKIKQKSRQVMR